MAWIWIQGHIQYISAMTTIIFIIGENHSVAFPTMINQGSRNWILLELNQSRKVEWLQVSIAEVFHESHSLFLQKKKLSQRKNYPIPICHILRYLQSFLLTLAITDYG